jgi:YD repeat-containing protein
MMIPRLRPAFWLFCIFVFSLSLVVTPAFSASVCYTYDVRHRLTHVAYDNGAVVQYSYDATGNRLTTSSSLPVSQTYEDAEDGNVGGWDIYDNDPAGATVTNVFDDERAGKVIEFVGSGTNNGYRLRNTDGTYWNNTNFKVLEWSMKYSESFTVYIAVQTKDGFRYLYYTPAATDSLGSSTYIHHGLGTHVRDGNWHTLVRDLAYDLKEAQPTNELQAVLGFLIRGSGRVDDIKTRKDIPANQDSDSDGITDTDEITIYGTRPYSADTDGDGINDKVELTYWGANWNADSDGDGIINLLDSDADNDGIRDGIEIAQGTDPADAASVPTTIVYEDAEDDNIGGWDIYDNDPAGATVTNVFDDDRAGKVIEFVGSGTNNGYRLRNTDGTYWNDTNFKILEWSMKYSESFTVYIAVQTKDGFRYLYYTPVATDSLGSSTYIHHGLGTHVQDGNWHTLVRDLAYDLKEAQPTNELQAVLGFLIRGSGRVDDIKTRKDIPANQDSDGDGITDTDEISLYGTHPYHADTDGDGINDKAERTYWGVNWNADSDGDGVINLLDSDADNDGIRDGIEIAQGTDPADAASVPMAIVYEDAEDGNIAGWDIYDNDPAGATVTNVYDDERAGKVIEFVGSGTNNGYRLRNTDGTYWNDTNFKVLEWSMKYSESFTVYIAVQTKDGFRYLYYTPAATSSLGTDTYVHHGLGTNILDGNWYTLVRDLQLDLKEAQPDNELQAVLGFLIRGSGRVDDIKTEKN